MRIKRLDIESFKNLRDLHIDFDDESPYTVLVGENGSGKSNLIEAITLIFRNLDLDIAAQFGYTIQYRCRGNELEIQAREGAQPRFFLKSAGSNGFEELSRRRFMEEDDDQRPLFRPAFVFGYYSGPSDRLASLYDRHKERFYRRIIKPATVADVGIDHNARRRLFYAETLHGQFALLAFFMEDAAGDSDRAFLRDHLQIEALDSVLFVLHRPPWHRKGGDPRFWNAEGEVRHFLTRLYEAAETPLRLVRRIPLDLTRNPSIEHLYLFLSGQEALSRVFQSYGSQFKFFTALESTHISKVLGEVRTRVRTTKAAGGGDITYRDLSEGEQQLLLVLGLLKFTANDETLFLLDEPDTHLNPQWSTQYLSFLDRFIVHTDSCHILMSTHDPLVFSGLTRGQVRIMRRTPFGTALIETPDEDPRGMGVEAILTSDLFRLRSTLDEGTQGELDEWRRLTYKEPLEDADTARLAELTERLRKLGLTQSIRDPLYREFLQAWTEREDPAWAESADLSVEQLEQRKRLAESIVAEMRSRV